MYDELWTAGKCMYKLEPVLADGGELIIYAPHLTEVCVTHGSHIEEIGYHCRDYFLKQWDKFKDVPWGVLAHSTHVRGLGTYREWRRALPGASDSGDADSAGEMPPASTWVTGTLPRFAKKSLPTAKKKVFFSCPRREKCFFNYSIRRIGRVETAGKAAAFCRVMVARLAPSGFLGRRKMSWITQMESAQPVAWAVLVFMLVAVVGLALSSIKVKGVGIGIAGVLFAGIILRSLWIPRRNRNPRVCPRVRPDPVRLYHRPSAWAGFLRLLPQSGLEA